jgi:hypothetical protein
MDFPPWQGGNRALKPSFAEPLFRVSARVPVSQNGILLSIPGLTIEVARQCSSIRSHHPHGRSSLS